MLSEKFRQALKLSKIPAYRLAWRVGLHPDTLSKFVCGYLRPRKGNERLLRLAKILGLSKDEVFEKGQDCAA